MLDDHLLNRSLFDLGEVLPVSNIQKTGLISVCEKAINKKLKDLSPNEIRVLVGQSISLSYVVPLALDLLERDPLIFAGRYKGDLLVRVLDIPKSFWIENQELNDRMVELKITVEEIFETINDEIIPKFSGFEY